MIFCGFVLVICLGLLQVIWDLSEMSAHASPHVQTTPPSAISGLKDGRSSADESSSAWDLRDTFVTPTFVAIGYQLGVLIRVASSNIERRFATFADVPYCDPLSRRQWEQLWRAEP